MLPWFRKLAGEEPKTKEDNSIEQPLTGSLRTSITPAINRPIIVDRALSNTFQVSNGAMDGLNFNINQPSVTDSQLAFYGSQGFIGYQTMAMLAQNWLIAKACDQPAKDAIRKGYEITVNDGTEVSAEVLDKIKEYDKAYGINKQMRQFLYFGRVFGIRIALFDIASSDPDYYEKPFNPDGITAGSYRGITQIDPYWITPILSGEAAVNAASRHFYEPTWWQVQGKKIHRSHLIIYRGAEVPDILKPTYLYGGLSVTQSIFERVYAAERTANEAPMLAQCKRETIMHTDVEKALADQMSFDSVMQQWTETRNNWGVRLVGIDDKIEQFDTSLADLDATIMTQYQLVASIAGVPVTKLLGTVPKGFNSTGEYDEASYHEELESIQTNDLQPLLERHHLCLMRSEIAPKFNIEPFNITIKWQPLDSTTAKEQAEINEIKARTGQVLMTSGAIDGIDERERVTADPTSGYTGLAEAEPELIDEETADE